MIFFKKKHFIPTSLERFEMFKDFSLRLILLKLLFEFIENEEFENLC